MSKFESQSELLGPYVGFGCRFPLSIHKQIQYIALLREWSFQHVLRKLIPLGLELYLSRNPSDVLDQED